MTDIFKTHQRLKVLLACVVIALLVAGAKLFYFASDPQLLFDRGLLSLQNHDGQSVRAVVDDLRKFPGWEKQSLFLMGALALGEGDPDGALYYFRHVPPEGELRKSILIMTGESLYKLGRFEDALNCFMPLADASAQSIDAHRWLAAIYFDIGAMDHALSQLNIVLQFAPGDLRAHRLAGRIYYDFESWSDAADHFGKAYQDAASPSDRQETGLELARALVKLLDYSQAKEICGQIEQVPEVACVLAECLWALGDAEAGLQILSEVLDKDSKNHSAQLLQARIHVESGHATKVIESLRDLADESPYQFEVQYLLTQALKQIGRPEEADMQFARQERARSAREKMALLNRQAIKQPTDPKVRLELAQLCRKMGNPELAEVWDRAARGFDSTGYVQSKNHSVNPQPAPIQDLEF
ncbi:MAG: tetratricopeptide repeat protein [Rhodopirellula sp.]|nr:tetratricopeptide repeat protein [Rhodopirellula sp.]